jgi:hypothetical protein
MSSLIRNIALVVILLIIVGVAYFTFFNNGTEEVLTSGVSGTEQAQLETQTLLSQLQDLQKIKIDQSIFSDPRFMSLQDFRQQLVDEPTGRANPFAPAP